MNTLKRPTKVTVTGAGEGTSLSWMTAMQVRWPWLEWGLLLSIGRQGEPRYPRMEWLAAAAERLGKDRVSLHLCGESVKMLLSGSDAEVVSLASKFGRVQLNFNAMKMGMPIQELLKAIGSLGGDSSKEVIVQMNSVNRCLLEHTLPGNLAWLFDASGGQGVVPGEWPAGIKGAHCGWAGGLGVENIEAEIQRIAEKAVRRYWIDCENKMRSDADELSPARVEAYLGRLAIKCSEME